MFLDDFMPLNNKVKLLLPFDNFFKSEKKICFELIKNYKMNFNIIERYQKQKSKKMV